MLNLDTKTKYGRLGSSWCMSDDDPSFSHNYTFAEIYKRFLILTLSCRK